MVNFLHSRTSILTTRLILLCFTLKIFTTCTSKHENVVKGPNVILIFTDQQTANAMSCTGNPLLKTPAMDMLAREGVLFKNAYCTSPVCGPSRSSIISGRMPHETGVEWNGQSMHEDIPNAGELFRAHGYETMWAGKWHLPESYPQRDAAKNKKVKGFEVLPFHNSKEKIWLLGAETDPPLTKAVVDYLNGYNKEKPLFLAVSYHNPHDICMYPRKDGWFSDGDSLQEIRYFGFESRLPDVIGKHPATFDTLPPLPGNHQIPELEPEFIQQKRKYHNEYGLETKLSNAEFGEMEWRGYVNAYYRLTEMVDAEIGKVIAALKANAMWENSIIVFTSDHGDGLAAHRWAAKLSFYEESSKIPMIVSYPGNISNGLVDDKHLVSQIDILPTMLDLAGIQPDISFSGKSLKSIIENQSSDWREFLVTELADYKPDTTRKGRMVRSNDYKYTLYSSGEEQLINLRNDPGEMQNLMNETQYSNVKTKHRQHLRAWASKTNDAFAMQALDN